jgi:hypothetical protein
MMFSRPFCRDPIKKQLTRYTATEVSVKPKVLNVLHETRTARAIRAQSSVRARRVALVLGF